MTAKGPPNLLPSAHCLAIARRNQKQSPLLRLPAELRTRIYEFTMDNNTDKILHDEYPEWDRLTFSRTSRLIFAETALSYFNHKLFPFHNAPRISLSSAKDWRVSLAKLTPSQRCLATEVAISWEQTHTMSKEEILDSIEGLPNLEVLDVMYPDDKYPRSPDWAGLLEYRDTLNMMSWLEKHVDIDAVLVWRELEDVRRWLTLS